MQRSTDVESQAEHHYDQLLEKRAETRHKGWADLNQCLALHFLEEFVGKRKESLADLAVKAARRGTETEGPLALRTLELVVITLGAEDSAVLVKEHQAALEALIRDEGRAATRKPR
jgi:hypothetical protein